MATTETKKEEAFLAAHDQFADAIFRHCYFRVSNRERAKELAQETFMRAWEYIASGRETVKNIRALLYRIAHNLVIDDYRRKKSDSLETLMENTSFQPTDPYIQSIPESLDTRMAVDRLLAGLNDAERQLIVMRYMEGLSPGDMGVILKESDNAISVRVHRAMKKMRARNGDIETKIRRI